MKKNYVPEKILKIMRISFLLWFVFLTNISANIYSQKFSFSNTENKTIKEILSEIEIHSNFKFLYRSDLVDVSKKIKLNISDTDIAHLLATILDPLDMTYRIFDDSLVVITNNVNLQQRMITGNVTDKTGNPLAGVTITVTGTSIGTLSDANGNFTIPLPSDGKTLSFSFIGMESQIIEIGSGNN